MRTCILVIMALFTYIHLNATERFVSFTSKEDNLFILAQDGVPADIVTAHSEDEGISMAVSNLQSDVFAVTGNKPKIIDNPKRNCLIIGKFDSPIINAIIENGKINKSELEGKYEKYIIQTVNNPIPGVEKALVIAGSDKRGTIYGIYELSRQIGVSPWYWWMDAPIVKHPNIYIKGGSYTDGEPKVAYRGIFINDDHPCFKDWCTEKFGGYNSKTYAHVCELILRLKGNYLWPAMWGTAFYDDDPMNGVIADKMGIVISTTHHEPMCLNQADWHRQGCPGGAWNYVTNSEGLKKFWTGGIQRAKNWEKIVSIGMRGDGDEAMDGSGNIALMERIIADQREIIENVTSRPAAETPQFWALYKEVQDYYDEGLKVPDDVILMLCDDNWGNIRRMPSLDRNKRHKGGYGMYYHVDYVGVPRNSKWINVSPIPRIWEQMKITYEHGVDKIWVLNVGDLKPMEYPITFFMDMAWDPDRYDYSNLTKHTDDFCESIFGEKYAKAASRLLRTYAKYNRRMIPEQLNHKTFSNNYGEWERVVAAYDRLAIDADSLDAALPIEYHSAFVQLLGYPVKACANLYDMYYAQNMNLKLAKGNNPEADLWAERVEYCFMRDRQLMEEYHALNNGKWNHFASEINMGYTSWNTPKAKIMPKVVRLNLNTDGLQIKLPEPRQENYSVAGLTPIFVEKDGYVSIEAEHYSRCHDGKGDARFIVIPEMGRTLSTVTTYPLTASTDGMSLEYDMDIVSDGYARVNLRFYSTLNYNDGGKGHRYAISFDNGEEQIIDINGHYRGELGEWQKEHVIDSETIHDMKPGRHTLKIRPLDAGICLQKINVNMGGLRKSFLWPDETLASTSMANR